MLTGRATFETEIPDWQDWDRAHLAHSRLAATWGGALIGWAALSPYSRRAVYVGVAEVSLYVGSAHRGKEIGSLKWHRALLSAGSPRVQGVTPADQALCRI